MDEPTIFVPYKARHLMYIDLQSAQKYFQPLINDPEYAASLEHLGPAWTCMKGDRVLGCGGFQEYYFGRAAMWALISKSVGAAMVPIHRRVFKEIHQSPYRRIEAVVAPSLVPVNHGFEMPDTFVEGHLWMDMLGFRVEVPCARNYLADGKAATLYVKTREAP